jgi:hypothetical protein
VTDVEELRAVVEELVGVAQLQAQEMQKLITHVEQRTSRLPQASQLPLVLSELSELHIRVKGFSSPKSGDLID